MSTIIGMILFFVPAGLVLWTFAEIAWGNRAIELPRPETTPVPPSEPLSNELQIFHLVQPQQVARSRSIQKILAWKFYIL